MKKDFSITVKIEQAGSRLCVPIPEEIMKAAKWETGDNLDFEIIDKDTFLVRGPKRK